MAMPLGSHLSASGAVARGLGSSRPRVSMRSPSRIARTMLVAGAPTALRVIELVVPTSFICTLSMPIFSPGKSRRSRQIGGSGSNRRFSKYVILSVIIISFIMERRTERPSMREKLVVVTHPLVQHKLTLMRSKVTDSGQFRQLLHEIGLLMLYEATRDLPLEDCEIETPLVRTRAPTLMGKKLCFVPILRAGLGFVDAMLELVPFARVGHIGLYRDPSTFTAVEYYLKLPEDIAECRTI